MWNFIASMYLLFISQISYSLLPPEDKICTFLLLKLGCSSIAVNLYLHWCYFVLLSVFCYNLVRVNNHRSCDCMLCECIKWSWSPLAIQQYKCPDHFLFSVVNVILSISVAVRNMVCDILPHCSIFYCVFSLMSLCMKQLCWYTVGLWVIYELLQLLLTINSFMLTNNYCLNGESPRCFAIYFSELINFMLL